MKRPLLLTFCFALLFAGLACGDDGSEVASTQPASATASATPRQPTTIVAASKPTVVATRPPEPTAEPATPEAPPPPQPTEAPLPDFSPFAEGWGRHGFGMTVTASGEATASWRVYKWCSDDPTPPCDEMTDSEIHSGGHATLIFDRVVGETAYGRVLETNEPDLLSAQVSLTLQPYDMAVLETNGSPMTLCGPNFWQEAPESLRQESPCGA